MRPAVRTPHRRLTAKKDRILPTPIDVERSTFLPEAMGAC
jgi:hypothetical protein